MSPPPGSIPAERNRFLNLLASIGRDVTVILSTHIVDQPYPDTRMLVDAIMAQTPEEYRYLVDDGFNRIVLYDNKAISAISQKTPDGKYKVTLNVQARKCRLTETESSPPCRWPTTSI
jgi:hypothetical protein